MLLRERIGCGSEAGVREGVVGGKGGTTWRDGFTVPCVEIPGAISEGETRKEALAPIKEAIELVF